jgi:uncharacterized membrane protein YfcA
LTLGAALLLALVGVLVGAVGLGGFLVVPTLVWLAGQDPADSVAAAALAFLAAGVVSALAPSSRRGPGTAPPGLTPGAGRAFLLAAGLGAGVGALAVGALVGGALTGLIAALVALAGVAEWFGLPRAAARRPPGTARSAGGGALVGFASALTGTSGPMAALPVLAFTPLSAHARLRLAQVAQWPVALGACAAFATQGNLPWGLGAACAAALCAGLLPGLWLAGRLGARPLRRLSALLMWGAAVAMALAGRS